MVELTKKRTVERIESTHEANGLVYNVSYEQEVTYDAKGAKSMGGISSIGINVFKDGCTVANADYNGNNRNIYNYQPLTSDESKQVANTVIDIFDTVLIKK